MSLKGLVYGLQDLQGYERGSGFRVMSGYKGKHRDMLALDCRCQSFSKSLGLDLCSSGLGCRVQGFGWMQMSFRACRVIEVEIYHDPPTALNWGDRAANSG